MSELLNQFDLLKAKIQESQIYAEQAREAMKKAEEIITELDVTGFNIELEK